MFADHDNPSTAAAAAPAQDSESDKAKNEENPAQAGAGEVVAGAKKPNIRLSGGHVALQTDDAHQGILIQ